MAIRLGEKIGDIVNLPKEWTSSGEPPSPPEHLWLVYWRVNPGEAVSGRYQYLNEEDKVMDLLRQAVATEQAPWLVETLKRVYVFGIWKLVDGFWAEVKYHAQDCLYVSGEAT